jgi:hypothetical protein
MIIKGTRPVGGLRADRLPASPISLLGAAPVAGTGVDSFAEPGTMAGMEITPELAEKVLRGGPDAIAVVRGIYQSHVEKLDALESEARKIRDAAALLPLVWISVAERMPEKHTAVLVHTDMDGNHAASFDGEEWFCDYGGAWLFPNVTHWMPLPEPPEVK